MFFLIMETTPVDGPVRCVHKPGVYRLIARSTMQKGEHCLNCVYEQVLPAIRKIGSYSIQSVYSSATLAAKQCASLLDKRR